MFVVKRPFRDAAGMVTAGSIVEPAGIKRFKHHVLEGHIVEVDEHNFERYTDFFKKRYGVDLPSVKPAETEETKNEVKQPEAPAETKNEVKQPEAPAETKNEVKQPEAPAETPATPAVTEGKATEVKKVVAAVAK